MLLNDETIYKRMPILNSKTNETLETITLYGENNPIALKLFNEFPLSMDCGCTDILSFDSNILLMIRDRGHALTIEINEIGPDDFLVSYFIPKICNVLMVNQLPGVRKVDENSEYTRGMFRTNLSHLNEDVYTFISGVPMDGDMFRLGGMFYNEDSIRDFKR